MAHKFLARIPQRMLLLLFTEMGKQREEKFVCGVEKETGYDEDLSF